MASQASGEVTTASEKSYGTLGDDGHSSSDPDGVSRKYSVESLLTWKIVTYWSGTVLASTSLWMQTLMLGVLFWVLFTILEVYRPKGFSKIVGDEASIRAFLGMFSTLIGLLLSFYTALNLKRWWEMRMGVQKIQDGSRCLTMLVSQGVTQDPVLLDTIQRYARASLFLIFAAAKTSGEHHLDAAVRIKLLSDEEKMKLETLSQHSAFVHAETLWVWLGNAVTRCHDQGLTKGPPHYCALMGACDAGRCGVNAVQALLDTQIPFGYAHLLCLMVKLHNLILTILMAITCVMHSGGDKGFQPVSVFRTAFRAFFMPFLYNAILMFNADVATPFETDGHGESADFDWDDLDSNMKRTLISYALAAENLPEWTSRRFAPIVTAQGEGKV